MKKNCLIGVVLLVVFIVGCQNIDKGLSHENSFVNKEKMMKLQEYGTTNIMKTLIRDTYITMSIGEKQVIGSGGCNLYSATIAVEGNQLQINDLISNEMFCQTPKDVMVQEEEFLNILENATRYDEVGNQFKVGTTDSRVLIFRVID